MGDDVLRVTAIDCPARELRSVAEVLFSSTAILALAARAVKPCYADAHTWRDFIDVIAAGFDRADHLVSGNDGRLPWCKLSFGYV